MGLAVSISAAPAVSSVIMEQLTRIKRTKNSSLHLFNFHHPFHYCVKVVIGLYSPPFQSFRKTMVLQFVAQQQQFQQFPKLSDQCKVYRIRDPRSCKFGQLYSLKCTVSQYRRLIILCMCLLLDVDQQLSNTSRSQTSYILLKYGEGLKLLLVVSFVFNACVVAVACSVSDEGYITNIVNVEEIN